MRILAIESSCDETAAAIVEDGTNVLSSTVSTSTKMHEQFGGILPEIAAREQLGYIIPVLTQTLHQAFPVSDSDTHLQTSDLSRRQADFRLLTDNIDALAVSIGPGLIGSLLIGVETAKTISFVTGLPLIPVNHVHAHIYANFVHSQKTKDESQKTEKIIQFPAIALVVSGGHTELFLMKSEQELQWLSGTIDDAAGEAFDKTARLLGFGNRGGVAIQEAALLCHPEPSGEGSRTNVRSDLHLPRPMLHDDTLNFSFSGLKTAVLREWEKMKPTSDNQLLTTAFAHEIQEAITDVLVTKTLRAAEHYDAQSILVGGGVAANKRLREKFSQLTTNNPPRQTRLTQLTIHFPPIDLCTDNAVTIGSCAFFRGKKTDWHTVSAVPDLSVEVTE
jgi:N6-L-threonylcarbamoyladenine synthase